MAVDPGRRNSFLLSLYGLTGSTLPADFRRQAFERLRGVLPFDAGLWATFTLGPQGPVGHSQFLHNLPDTMLVEYEDVRQYDIVNQEAVAHCGHTSNVELTRMEGIAHPAIIRHARRWRMEHTLATMQLELPIHLYTAICLYRHDANARFSEGDRQFKEDIVPHLVQAWHINAIHTLDAPPPMRGVPRARAVVDRFGLIHNAESSFASLLQLEFGGWQGPRLPDAIMHIVGGDVDVHRGFGVIISLSQQLPDGTSVVTVRVKTALDGLTRREMTVARAFASGKSYRQIAAQLGTSPATVRTQIQAIYMKIGVRTKVGLVHAVEAYLGSAPPLR